MGGNLYHLDIYPHVSNSTGESAYLATSSTHPICLWHQCLAHVCYRTIEKMAKYRLVDGLALSPNNAIPVSPCVGYTSGQMKRLPFPIGHTRATSPSELIHTDVCGPMPVKSPGGRARITFGPLFRKRSPVLHRFHQMITADGEPYIFLKKIKSSKLF